MVGVLAVQAGCAYFRSVWFAEVGERTLADLRQDTFARLVRLPLEFHNRRRVGELASRIAADLSQIQGTLIGSFPDFLRQVATLVGGVALIAWTSWRLTLVMMASLPALEKFVAADAEDRWSRLALVEALRRLDRRDGAGCAGRHGSVPGAVVCWDRAADRMAGSSGGKDAARAEPGHGDQTADDPRRSDREAPERRF